MNNFSITMIITVAIVWWIMGKIKDY